MRPDHTRVAVSLLLLALFTRGVHSDENPPHYHLKTQLQFQPSRFLRIKLLTTRISNAGLLRENNYTCPTTNVSSPSLSSFTGTPASTTQVSPEASGRHQWGCSTIEIRRTFFVVAAARTFREETKKHVTELARMELRHHPPDRSRASTLFMSQSCQSRQETLGIEVGKSVGGLPSTHINPKCATLMKIWLCHREVPVW